MNSNFAEKSFERLEIDPEGRLSAYLAGAEKNGIAGKWKSYGDETTHLYLQHYDMATHPIQLENEAQTHELSRAAIVRTLIDAAMEDHISLMLIITPEPVEHSELLPI